MMVRPAAAAGDKGLRGHGQLAAKVIRVLRRAPSPAARAAASSTVSKGGGGVSAERRSVTGRPF